ncbi:AAA family ATPase, partial [Streptomyces sp. SID5475]|nr:AAA family ATPase [Streptomyces sp. SID5475]
MARARTAVRGRDQELAVVRDALAAGGGRLIVLKGQPGIGRTALLDEAERMLRAAGLRVLPVRPGAGQDSRGDDAFALAPLVRTVRDRFEEFREAGPADALAAVARLSDAAGRDTGGWRPSIVTALGELFDGIGRQGRTAVLADDVHAVAEPAPVLTAARRSGHLVLATCETGAEHSPGLAELLAAADRVVTLGPLAGDVAESLVRRAQGARLDEAVPGILRTALGPLFGNPGTVLATLADLRARGRLTVFRGRLCLRAPSEPIELPAGHHLLRRAAALGDPAARLLSSVAVWDGVNVTDLPLLAEVIGTGLTDCGRVLDQLIEAEVLVADPAGHVSCRCPALAAS